MPIPEGHYLHLSCSLVAQLFLQTGSEGPPLISHVPSWRTFTYLYVTNLIDR